MIEKLGLCDKPVTIFGITWLYKESKANIFPAKATSKTGVGCTSVTVISVLTIPRSRVDLGDQDGTKCSVSYRVHSEYFSVS